MTKNFFRERNFILHLVQKRSYDTLNRKLLSPSDLLTAGFAIY